MRPLNWAIAHLQRGLSLLATQPETPERDAREIELQLVLGSSSVVAVGNDSQEVTDAYRRACELAKAINIIEMEIEDAVAKIRSTGVSDEEDDYAVPVWCAVLPLRTVLGQPEECPRQAPGVTPEAGGLGSYVPGRRLDEVILETYAKSYSG